MNPLLTQPITHFHGRRETPAASESAPARRPAALEPPPRILYADDDAQLRRLGELALVKSGYEVDTAEDGATAWAALQERNYHLLITDHDMPRLTGMELAAQARLAGMRLPIILASGSVGVLRDPSTDWLKLAARLPKPFGPDALLETVAQTVRPANHLRECSGTMISVLVQVARVQSYPHGGINE